MVQTGFIGSTLSATHGSSERNNNYDPINVFKGDEVEKESLGRR